MQVTMDGTCRYAGHKIINYKDGRTFASLSVVDEKNQPLNVFCPGTVISTLQDCTFGDELQLVFTVNQFNNNLNLRCLEVLRCVR